jgi:hypothetical protein
LEPAFDRVPRNAGPRTVAVAALGVLLVAGSAAALTRGRTLRSGAQPAPARQLPVAPLAEPATPLPLQTSHFTNVRADDVYDDDPPPSARRHAAPPPRRAHVRRAARPLLPPDEDDILKPSFAE